MISRTSKHALAALTTLAELPNGQYVGAGEIAGNIDAPRNYLGKLLKTLADEGILESQKGKGGGFRLARDPAAIRLIEAVGPIDRVSRWSDCFLGRGRCSVDSPCAVHGRWAEVRDIYLDFLRETTIADLAARAKIGANRTSWSPSSKEVSHETDRHSDRRTPGDRASLGVSRKNRRAL